VHTCSRRALAGVVGLQDLQPLGLQSGQEVLARVVAAAQCGPARVVVAEGVLVDWVVWRHAAAGQSVYKWKGARREAGGAGIDGSRAVRSCE
jgi:hypothetical protein